MAIYKKVKKLSPEEAAYIAGLIDGEGTIALTRKHRGEYRQLMVSISSTEPPLLKYVKKAIGAGRITNKCTHQANHTPSVTYAISNRQALALLEQVRPYLKTYKAKRAHLILRSYIRLTPRNGKYTLALLKERDIFIEKFLRLNPRRQILATESPD
ncbi:MAG: LAGLIDADG family homing endonuclease [Sulfuricaulis sp.]|uniref:LAGLIDADG family homing endonuclease n=1 Tax=Sulfuricaulis sp. TaxID=2003553 RepID=UPI0034A380A8